VRYIDASALVKLYLDEPGSESLGSEVTGRTDVVLSDLSITECVSALARRVREGTAPSEFVSRLYHAILDHLEAGRFERLDFTPEVHREAERLMLAGLPLRAGDSLHLASATLAGAEAMITFDRQLAAAARTLGMEVVP
jgi:uncharacterized protein